MSTLMTRGERRGLIVLLALLAVIVGVSIFDKGFNSSVRFVTSNSNDSVLSVAGDSINISDDKRKRTKRTKKTTKKRQPVTERNPLDEKIPSQ